MLTYLLIVGLLIALGCIVTLIVIIRRTLHKNSVYEQWILDLKQDVNDTYNQMVEIDREGTFASRLNEEGLFESDDQVGQVFKALLDLIKKLNERAQ
jgi:hypothetical protein